MSDPLRVSTLITSGRTLHRAQLVWLARDPAAVRLVIEPARGVPPPRRVPAEDDRCRRPAQEVWEFARSLLRDGLMGLPPSAGHVRLRSPRKGVLRIGLLTPGGWWSGCTDPKPVTTFLAATYCQVGVSEEQALVADTAQRLDPSVLTQREELS